jgi:hypothetical protein
MRAPVYRDIEAQESLLGLAFPSEAFAVVTVVMFCLTCFDDVRIALVALVASYVGIRALTYGKPPHHLQHLVARHLRRRLSKGRVCAASRARHEAFPFTAVAPWFHVVQRAQTSARRPSDAQ